ncbi:MAG TPA: phosphoribosylglycinamide formyltransferase [Spirochaetia bacterium]|nr:phosphoribosylglycinamide formyltransferase [Spirochaetia bacterium]
MAKIAVLASGSGSNFQAIVAALADPARNPAGHRVALLICDKPGAGCLSRADRWKIPSRVFPYSRGATEADRVSVEKAMTEALEASEIQLVVLAGFMRILTPVFVGRWKGKLVNIHPALLPWHKGAHGIADSFASTDPELGVTVHWVDEGVDTGVILAQRSFPRTPTLTLEEAEATIHALEHELYPATILSLLENRP